MSDKTKEELAALIVTKAKERLEPTWRVLPAWRTLKQSPSHLISERMPAFANVGAKEVEGRRPGQVDWPEGAKSAIVIAIEHPEDKPELDWWILGGKSARPATRPAITLLIAAGNKAGGLDRAAIGHHEFPARPTTSNWVPFI